ncbi:hypothetical protein OIO90_003681 [Microbotryomycetes sp. JL221]|nr:hypothetical protein OIO90_003681 [Microbotryomycetes sp. JL221]
MASTSSTHRPASTTSSEAWARDPFVDPRISLDSNNSGAAYSATGYIPGRHSTTTAASSIVSSSHDGASFAGNGWGSHDQSASSRTQQQQQESLRNDSESPKPIVSSQNPTRPRGYTLQVSNELNDALNDELDHNPTDREMLKAERMRDRPLRNVSGSSSRRDSDGDKDGLWHQLRTGTGWFSPVVQPEPTLTREEREAKERARIDKLKDTGKGSGRSTRPSFMKRMSSGVEMLGFGGGGKDR